MKKLTPILLVLFIIPLTGFSAPSNNWSLMDALQIKWVGNVRPSPDGTKVLYQTISTNVLSKRWHRQIYLAERSPMSHKMKSRLIGNGYDPQWAPSGEWFSYLNEKGNMLVMIKPDPQQKQFIYRLPTRPLLYAWSPDMSKIALVTPNLLQLKKRKKPSRYNYAKHVINNRLYWINVHFEKKKKDKGYALTSPKFDVATDSIAWTADSKNIIFSKQASPQESDWMFANIAEINLKTKKTKNITEQPAYNHHPVISPDGKWIAFESNREFLDGRKYFSSDIAEAYHTLIQICLTPINRNDMINRESTHCLKPIFSHNAKIIGWNKKSDNVYVAADNKTLLSLYSINIKTSELTNVSGTHLLREPHMNLSHSYIGFTSESLTKPPEAFW